MTKAGFYEPAYRLEVYCRTADLDTTKVSLSADLSVSESPSEEAVVAFLDTAQLIPAYVDRGLLVAEAGAGKTTALAQMERLWAIPCRPKLPGAREPWVPVFVPSAKLRTTEELRWAFLSRSECSLPTADPIRQPMPCHLLLSTHATFESLRWLFSSPVYYLVDDFEALTGRENEVWMSTAALPGRAGCLAAVRCFQSPSVETGGRWKTTALRGLTPEQLQELAQKQGNSRILPEWLGWTDRPLSRYLRNPFLATLVARLLQRQPGFPILESSLAEILDDGMKPDQNVDPYVWFDWLPRLALDIKQDGVCTDDNLLIPERIAAARRMGLLRESASLKPVEFRHNLILDFFAACRVRQKAEGEGMRKGLSDLLGNPQLRRQWTDVLVILAGLITPARLGELVDALIAENEPQLAHTALLGVKPANFEDAGRLAARTGWGVLNSFRNSTSKIRISAFSSLGCLDPRLGLPASVGNLVEIVPGNLWMSRYPVTNMEYAAYLRDTKSASYPPGWLDESINVPNYPVTGVSLQDATNYTLWLNSALEHTLDGREFCLPTAEEWDLAAHSDSAPSVLELRKQMVEIAAYLGADREEIDAEEWQRAVDSLVAAVRLRAAALTGQPESGTEEAARAERRPERFPVGTFPLESDIHDLFGQVWQWCDSWLPLMPGRPSISPERAGIPVIVKGGVSGRLPAWTIIGGWLDPSTRANNVGFRVCARLK
jgi:formylglycine-generating enzyme required for sulfatase activity